MNSKQDLGWSSVRTYTESSTPLTDVSIAALEATITVMKRKLERYAEAAFYGVDQRMSDRIMKVAQTAAEHHGTPERTGDYYRAALSVVAQGTTYPYVEIRPDPQLHPFTLEFRYGNRTVWRIITINPNEE